MQTCLFRLVFLLALLSTAAKADSLNEAANRGDVAAITAMLDAGASVNPADGSRPPLHNAVKRGHLAAAKLLMERGADVNSVTRYGGPPLLTAALQNNVELITLLLDHGANVHASFEYETALHIAAKNGCLACVKKLVEAGADVNSVIWGGNYARTPLHLATFYGYTEVAEFLMSKGVVFPQPNPIEELLPTAQPKRAEEYFKKDCAYCHDVSVQRMAPKRGPNLWNVVGRPKASVPGQLYSNALRNWKGDWTYQDLNYWIFSFAVGTPGVTMEIPGLTDDQLRADMIEYLRISSDAPLPLP